MRKDKIRLKKISFFSEFKTFLLEGNALNLAVGVIIGAAMKDLVNSLVKDIFGPIIGSFTGKVDFSDFAIQIGDSITIKYGSFVTQLINFVIMAFVVFLIVKMFAGLKDISFNKKEELIPEVKICPFCKTEIAFDATRCPHCTSILTEEIAKE